jgi:ribosomal protein L16/L10AE
MCISVAGTARILGYQLGAARRWAKTKMSNKVGVKIRVEESV